jgi:putative methyltransferase (TIGR04325 family)
MTLKALFKLLLPPILVEGYRIFRPRANLIYGLSGDYRSWGEAVIASTGYDSELILEKTRAALLQVKNGQAVYERDSVVFDQVRYDWPLLAGLLWVAAQSDGRLDVLDFGGSLGSTYFQNRALLSRLKEVRWNIVEQRRHVEVGREYFEDQHLKFYLSIDDCLVATQPNAVILSSVLHYLEHPYDLLRAALGLRCNHVFIDRTPFWDGPTDRLCVQHVPPSIYSASYPSWIFSMHRFRSHLPQNWEVVTEFDCLETLKGPVEMAYKGMILVRQNALNQQGDQ